jgi:hypothetical protein
MVSVEAGVQEHMAVKKLNVGHPFSMVCVLSARELGYVI